MRPCGLYGLSIPKPSSGLACVPRLERWVYLYFLPSWKSSYCRDDVRLWKGVWWFGLHGEIKGMGGVGCCGVLPKACRFILTKALLASGATDNSSPESEV